MRTLDSNWLPYHKADDMLEDAVNTAILYGPVTVRVGTMFMTMQDLHQFWNQISKVLPIRLVQARTNKVPVTHFIKAR